MADEKTATEFLVGLAALIIGGLTGHNYLQIGKLREDKAAIPEKYRSKGDCDKICEASREQMAEMTKEVRHGFERIYDKLDGKADKGPRP